MASVNKKNKLKNSYGAPGTLKNKINHIKRFLFYTPSTRNFYKKDLKKLVDFTLI